MHHKFITQGAPTLFCPTRLEPYFFKYTFKKMSCNIGTHTVNFHHSYTAPINKALDTNRREAQTCPAQCPVPFYLPLLTAVLWHIQYYEIWFCNTMTNKTGCCAEADCQPVWALLGYTSICSLEGSGWDSWCPSNIFFQQVCLQVFSELIVPPSGHVLSLPDVKWTTSLCSGFSIKQVQ